LNSGIEEFDLKGPVLHVALLPDKLVETVLANFARAVGSVIGSMVIARSGAVQFDFEANRLTVMGWA
jgi:hypothetical protein